MKTVPRRGRGSLLLCVSLLVSLLLITGPVASAQASAKANRDSAENLTLSLMALNAQYRAASPEEKTGLLLQLQSVAAQRQQVLSALVQTRPGEVLRVAIPGNVAAGLAPEIQSFVEQETDAQGELEVMYEDAESEATLHHFLKTGGQRLELKFAANAPTNLLTGAIVHVHGTRVGGSLALACCTDGGGGGFQVMQQAPLSNTFGAQTTLVMLVNFQDNTSQPYTISDITNTVFGSGNSATNWDLENSLQQTWLTGTVVGWYTLPLSAASCPDNNTIATDANAAATAAGINLSGYTHFMYAFPFLSTCYGWLGLATVGGVPAESWINGQPTLKLVTHEMGHNFGLYHSHSLSCGNTQTLCSNPTIGEYGDSIDTMGNPSYGHFNAFQKERLGWLNYGISPPINWVQSNGTYTIGPYENQDSTTKALKILKSTDPTSGAKTWYYVQYSQAVGFDSFLSNDSNVLGGVLVHIGTDNDGNSNDLLNMAPSLNNFYYSALDVGQTFIDPSAGLTMQTLSADPTGASVSVRFGTPSCQHFNPTISLSPSQSQTVAAGTAVTYTLSILNNDNAGCSPAVFNLTDSIPPGWAASFGNASVTLAYGTSGSSSIQVVSPNNAPTGTYTFTTTATNSAAPTLTASTSATYNLNTAPCTHTNPTVTFSPVTQSVQAGTTAMYILGVRNNDNASCNSSTFSLGDSVPSGWTAALGISALTISAGGSASTSLQVTSPSNTSGGSYGVAGSATSTTDNTYTGSAAASYVIPGGCTRANPTVTMSPSQSQSVTPGTPVGFTVSVQNNDGSACAATNFNLAANLLSGWTGNWSKSTLALSPGGSSSATLTVTSPTTAAGGPYTIGTTATDASATSYAGSATANYVIASSTNVSISVTTDSASYFPGQTVGITVAVTSGGSPVAGASVNVAVTAPNGNATALSATTGSNGLAMLNYRLRKQATSGMYQAQASIASSRKAASTVFASTTFVVQ
jgi:uncharacterized membrane protein